MTVIKPNEKYLVLACKKQDNTLLFIFQMGEGSNTSLGTTIKSITTDESYTKVAKPASLDLLAQGEACVVIDVTVLHEENEHKTSGDLFYSDENGNLFLPLNGGAE